MLEARLIEHIFKAASMERWNDYARIMTLSELDKQAHKFIIAFFLAKLEGVKLIEVIEAGVFEMLARIIITDIRPDVYHELVKDEAVKKSLYSWAIEELTPLINKLDEGEFLKRFKNYLQDKEKSKLKQILRSASYLASLWEFKIIYQSNAFLSDIKALKLEMEADLKKPFNKSKNMLNLLEGDLSFIVDLSGRLRFQKRWSSTPRVPATSVLGHMLIVALLAYFESLKSKLCASSLESNFYCALFHDLPESLTRDIISPVKYGAKLDSALNEYEILLIKTKILPKVPASISPYFSYLLGLYEDKGVLCKDEFSKRIFTKGEVKLCKDLKAKGLDKYHAIDGKMLKASDNLAAFLEAGISINFGIKTKELERAFKNLYKKLEKDEYFAKLTKELLSFYDLQGFVKD